MLDLGVGTGSGVGWQRTQSLLACGERNQGEPEGGTEGLGWAGSFSFCKIDMESKQITMSYMQKETLNLDFLEVSNATLCIL
jgi:hypothetical protein